PIELHATADRGTFDLRELQASLPGLRVQGRGRGTTQAIQASVDLDATDLARLGRTFGGLSASRVPPLSGSGKLHLEASGALRHPGVSAEGKFASLRVNDVRVRALALSAHMGDIDRPLDANAQVKAEELRLGERVLKPVSLTLLTRGRALDLHAGTSGFLPLEVHVGGTVDEDRRGIELEALAIRYPEAAWSMHPPAHLRFTSDEPSLEPMRLVAEGQAIRLGGWKRRNRVDVAVALETVDLGKLPHALVPSSVPLGGRVSLEAKARGSLS